MTPTEANFALRVMATLCAFVLLGSLLGVAAIVEVARRRRPEGDTVCLYTLLITAATVAGVAYLLIGDTP